MISSYGNFVDYGIKPQKGSRYFISETDLAELLNEKNDFVSNYTRDVNHLNSSYPEIAESWVRSRNSGVIVEPEELTQPFMNQDGVSKVLEDNKVLINAAVPVFNAFKRTVSSDYTLSLIDKNGVLILQEGTIPNTSPTLTPAIGTVWNEDRMGTNAYSISKQFSCPVQLPGILHYSPIFDNLMSSVTPITNEKSELIASLAFVQPMKLSLWEEQHIQNEYILGLLIAIGAGIESNIKLDKSYTALKTTHNKLAISMEFIGNGIITIDENGNIVEVNNEGARIFKQKDEQIRGKNISEFLYNSSRIMGCVARGEDADIEAALCTNNKEESYLINVRTIRSSTEIEAAVLKFNEIEKINAMVAKRAGGTARFVFEDIIGQSTKFNCAVNRSKRFAKTPENILLIGESGTGKEIFAQAMHNEHNSNGPFIAINCAAMPRNLIESELFGYEAGSFTGAERTGRPGKIELAHEGTLFLDEIGDMPYELQAVLLRVLEDKQVMRIGGNRYKKINFRLIAATNKDLCELVKQKAFREDLYYRLSVLSINLPPLCERGDDVEILSQYFLDTYCSKMRRTMLKISPEVIHILKTYNWPGNIRELENAIIYAVNSEHTDIIQPESLPANILSGYQQNTKDNIGGRTEDNDKYALHNLELTAIKTALAHTNNNIPMAADLLEIGRSTLYRKLKKYDIRV